MNDINYLSPVKQGSRFKKVDLSFNYSQFPG